MIVRIVSLLGCSWLAGGRGRILVLPRQWRRGMPRVRDGCLEEGPLAAFQLVPQLLQIGAVLCTAAAGASGAAEGSHFRHRGHHPPLLVLAVSRLVRCYEAARRDLAARVHTGHMLVQSLYIGCSCTHRARVSSSHTLYWLLVYTQGTC